MSEVYFVVENSINCYGDNSLFFPQEFRLATTKDDIGSTDVPNCHSTTELQYTIQHFTALQYTIKYCTALHCDTLFSTALHCTAIHYT